MEPFHRTVWFRAMYKMYISNYLGLQKKPADQWYSRHIFFMTWALTVTWTLRWQPKHWLTMMYYTKSDLTKGWKILKISSGQPPNTWTAVCSESNIIPASITSFQLKEVNVRIQCFVLCCCKSGGYSLLLAVSSSPHVTASPKNIQVGWLSHFLPQEWVRSDRAPWGWGRREGVRNAAWQSTRVEVPVLHSVKDTPSSSTLHTLST